MHLPRTCTLALLSLSSVSGYAANQAAPWIEKDGMVAIEAEDFVSQELTNLREWKVISDDDNAASASEGAYLQILPDTRTTHDDKLRHGVNFSNESGVIAVLSYPVRFENPGRYYVWVRAYSTGSEDNGIHTGINDTWPDSGRKMQWCEGKNDWRWESKQRTGENHCGEPYLIFLDVPNPGIHDIQFSMREDGFRFDRFFLTLDREFERPDGLGPDTSPRETVAEEPDEVTISGELKTWHPVTLDLVGPEASENSISPNPFLEYNYEVEFTHSSGEPNYRIPGYFAADGKAAETSASSGKIWRAHLSPDKAGTWNYRIHLKTGKEASVNGTGKPLAPWDGITGEFEIQPTDKTGRDFRASGRLEFVGERYLRFAENGELFLKMGADAPETLLAYRDFDGTVSGNPKSPLKTWTPHRRDSAEEDPTWKDGLGKGLLGAINYLASAGANSISFLTYNAGGDGDNVWPFIARDDKVHYDVSKLAQWDRVFAHAQNRGVYLHFKLQENELDDERARSHRIARSIPTALDGGKLGVERKLYLREMVARFGHHLALNWNLGEENTQTVEEVRAMADYLKFIDPYDHHIVIHTFPNQQDYIYPDLLHNRVPLTGVSVQTEWDQVHDRTLQWIETSEAADTVWVVANDEQGPADMGVPPDPGYEGFDGQAKDRHGNYDLHDIRKETLWGNLMAGGAGVEYYFGYRLPENDLLAEDFRSRAQSWEYGRIALEFFKTQNLPLTVMRSDDKRVANSPARSFALVKPNEAYLAYSTGGGKVLLDLSDATGSYSVLWYNPRSGESHPSNTRVKGGDEVELDTPAPANAEEDWVVLLRREN